jgi:hypothetical protein
VHVYSHIFLTSSLAGCVVSFTPRPLYPRGKSSRYPLNKTLDGPQSWCGRRGEEKILTILGLELRNLDRPARSQSLYRLSLSLVLRPTVSRPVCLEIKHPSGFTTRFLLLSDSCKFVDMELFLTSGQVCRLQLLLALASAVIFVPNTVRLVTIFYCLRFEASLFVASFKSQGYGGGIGPRLHTGGYTDYAIPAP